MELEHHEIELRYEALRLRDPARESRLAASLLAEGQRHPVLVITVPGARAVLVDGYRRVRALAAIHRDVVQALDLTCAADEALLRAWRLGVGRRPEAIEEAWLLRELRDEHGLAQRDLAVRTGRTVSWVSRRLALVAVLPEAVQARLRAGAVGAYAAQRVLVPLARANPAHCERFVEVLAREPLSARQLAQWWRAWRAGDAAVRERLVADPLLYLRTVAAVDRRLVLPAESPEGRAAALLGTVAGACRRARAQLGPLLTTHPELTAHDGVHAATRQARGAWQALTDALEMIDAGRRPADRDPDAA
jgi:hypothetical protein